MKRFLIIASTCVLIIEYGQWSYAEFNSAVCFTGCFTANKDCIARITAVNDIEISDETEVCNNNKIECDDKCFAALKEDADQKEKILQQQREQFPQEQGDQPAQEQQD